MLRLGKLHYVAALNVLESVLFRIELLFCLSEFGIQELGCSVDLLFSGLDVPLDKKRCDSISGSRCLVWIDIGTRNAN